MRARARYVPARAARGLFHQRGARVERVQVHRDVRGLFVPLRGEVELRGPLEPVARRPRQRVAARLEQRVARSGKIAVAAGPHQRALRAAVRRLDDLVEVHGVVEPARGA